MSDSDPDTWKQVGGGMLAAITGALGWLWRKLDGTASKEELSKAITAVEKSSDGWRETTRMLFANAESDRRENNERFTRALEKIHEAENKSAAASLELMGEVVRAATAANTASQAANAATTAAAAILAGVKK